MSEIKPAASAYQLFQKQKHAEVKASLEVCRHEVTTDGGLYPFPSPALDRDKLKDKDTDGCCLLRSPVVRVVVLRCCGVGEISNTDVGYYMI